MVGQNPVVAALMPSTSSRMTFVEDSMRLLWPNRTADDPPFVVLPSRRAPRLLVPRRPRRAAASAAVRYTAQQSLPDRTKSAALALAVWGGALSVLPHVRPAPGAPDRESIDDYLSDALRTCVRTTLAITAPRANRKAVLQVFDRGGRTLGFAKVGTYDVTNALIDHEADTLEGLHRTGLTALDVPRVLHRGSWGDSRVAVLAALPRGGRVSVGADPLHSAMREVGALGVVEPTVALAAFRASGDAGLNAGLGRFAEWLAVLRRVEHTHAVHELTWGTWHGDWTQWNCSLRRGRIAVWDWERCAAETPVGCDRLHFVFNQAVGPKRDRFAKAAVALIDDAPSLLSLWGMSSAQARATAVVYLLKICFRYLLDDAPTQSIGSRVEQWAYPAIARSVGRAGVTDGRRHAS